mgnify:CR=1 FL=1
MNKKLLNKQKGPELQLGKVYTAPFGKAMKETYKSKVYTDRPAYADFDAPAKFEAIKSIIAKRLREHPNATCSYSGGSDSDILLHLIASLQYIMLFSTRGLKWKQ